MGNALVLSRFGGDIAGLKSYVGALRNVATVVGALDGKDILRCDKDTGNWLFGQNKTPLEDGDLLVINPASFKHGYVAFAAKGDAIAEDIDGEPANIFLPITAPLPRWDSLPELEQPKRGKGPEWAFQIGFDLVVAEGPNAGAEMTFKPTSLGGKKMVAKMTEEIARRLDDELEDIVPVIELFSTSYKHKVYGKIYTPEFEILEWCGLDDDALKGSAEPEERPKKGAKATESGKTRKTSELKRREAERDDDPEEDEDDKPARGRSRRGVDSPTDKVARGARRHREDAEDDDDKPARGRGGRRARDEEPEDDEPKTRTRGRRASRDDDDEIDAKPARSRRGRDDNDDADERPARSRRGRDPEPDDDAEDAPRRSRRAAEPEDEPKAGVRGRRAAAGGRKVEDEDEDERPARGRSRR